MKCKNCGAELNNGYCEYCGSFFEEHQRFKIIRKLLTESIPPKSALGVIQIDVGELPDYKEGGEGEYGRCNKTNGLKRVERSN